MIARNAVTDWSFSSGMSNLSHSGMLSGLKNAMAENSNGIAKSGVTHKPDKTQSPILKLLTNHSFASREDSSLRSE